MLVVGLTGGIGAGKSTVSSLLAGRGAVSFAEAIDTLHGLSYEGYISFEWEKYWHPEIEEPEVAFEDFATAMKLALRCERGKESQELQV